VGNKGEIQMISFATAEPQDIETAFKFAGLDEVARYAHIESSIGMAGALKREGYRGLTSDRGFIKPVR
jgi:hypothetical protein